MRKTGIILLAIITTASMAMILGCGGGGGGGGGGDLPKSSPAYAGSQHAAVIDSTTVLDYAWFLEELDRLSGEFEYGLKMFAGDSGSDTFEGSVSGTYIEDWSWSESESSDSYRVKGTYSGGSDPYKDSGVNYPYVLAGEGSWEGRYSDSDTIDLWTLTTHMNYSAFSESTDSSVESYSGYLTGTWNVWSDIWEGEESANIAYSSLPDGYYLGLLDATRNVAWDGSFTTYTGQGTLCAENYESNLDGCVDYEIDVTWDYNLSEGGEEPCLYCDYPTGGTVTLSTIDASAIYDYGYTSDPWCWLYSVDADNDSAYEYTSVECD